MSGEYPVELYKRGHTYEDIELLSSRDGWAVNMVIIHHHSLGVGCEGPAEANTPPKTRQEERDNTIIT